MGSITLPALHLNPPPQQASPLEQYGQLLQLRNQMQTAPLQQQALQQENQQRAMQLRDQQAMTSAMQQWDGKSLNDLAPLVLKNGGSATSVMGLKQHALEMQKQYSDIAKTDADTGATNLATLKNKADMVSGATRNGVAQTPDDQPTSAGHHCHDCSNSCAAAKICSTPSTFRLAQQIAQAGASLQQIRSQLDVMRKSLLANSQLMDEAAKKATANKENAQADELRGKINPTSPLYAPTPAAVALGTAPGSAQIQANEVRQAARKAGAEEGARMPGEMALAQQKQALSQGDPNAAGQLLVNGDATLSELKSRGATPDFIARSLFAARQLSNGQYNAQTADAGYSVSKSPANVAFFGSAKSLTDKGGTLDQLADAAKQIPGGQIPAFNSLADWEKAATGSGPIAKYASIALGVADDYSKVMGGGQGSDTSRAQALARIAANQSPEQRAASIEGVRGSVSSQMVGRIGKNPVLNRMYGEAAGPQGGSGMIRAIDDKSVLHQAPDQASAIAFGRMRRNERGDDGL